MAISAEIKAKISDPSVLEAIETNEKLLYETTEESKKRKLELRNLNNLLEKVKKLGLDPEGDVEDQMTALLEETTKKKNLKPASELDTLSKQLKKLTDELNSWKAQAEKSEREASLEKARSAFSQRLTEPFGKNSSLILDNAIMKGLITTDKNGIPGVIHDEEFFPVEAEKGRFSALDILKKVYSDHIVVKQKAGGSDVNTRIAQGGQNLISRADFEALPQTQKFQYMKEVGQFSE
jgi:hypothetical protein